MITIEELKKVAQLSKLHFDESSLKILQKSITNVMENIDTLQEVDCSNIEPLRSVVNSKAFTRDDVVKENDISSVLFDNTPDQSKSLAKKVQSFVVPKIVE